MFQKSFRHYITDRKVDTTGDGFDEIRDVAEQYVTDTCSNRDLHEKAIPISVFCINKFSRNYLLQD